MAKDFELEYTITANVDAKQLKSQLDNLRKALLSLKSKDIIDDDKTIADIKKIEKEIDKLDSSIEEVAKDTKQINIGLQAVSKTTSTLKDKFKSMGATLKSSLSGTFAQFTAAGLATQAITSAVTGLTSALSEANEEFKQIDVQSRNVGTLGVKNFEDFGDAALALSQTVPDSASSIISGIYDAVSAGTIKVPDGIADVKAGMEFMNTAAKLATAGLTTTKDAVNGLTSTMNAYKIPTEDAIKVSDILFNTVKQGKTTVPELNAALSNVIPTAASLGVSFAQVGGALATMTKQGVPTAQATTQLRAALVELSKPGISLAPILAKAEISM